MKTRKTVLLGIGGAFAGAMLLGLVAPKTAHAMVAALVQVANTRTNPVPNQEVDHPARNSFTASCNVLAAGDLTCIPSPVPTGTNTKIVIQNVTMGVSGGDPTQGPSVTSVVYRTDAGFSNSWLPFVPQGPRQWSVNQFVTLYADPGPNGAAECSAQISDQGNNHSLQCTISGYAVTLP